MSQGNNRLTTGQGTVIVINYMLGIGLLSMPKAAAQTVGTPDIWISVLLSGLCTIGVGMVMVMLCRRFPGQTGFQFIQSIIGRWTGRLLGIIMVVYFIAMAALEVRYMMEVTGLYLLERAPSWSIVLLFLWAAAYLALGGLNAMVRLFEIVLPVTLIVFVLEILLSIKMFDINNLRPVLGEGILPVLRGIQPTLLVFASYEVLFVLMAFMSGPKEGRKAFMLGVSVTTLIYMITIVMVIGGLSVDGAESRNWPTLDLMRSFEIEGLIFERFESPLLVIWILQLFNNFVVTHYCASIGIRHLFGIQKPAPVILALLPVIYLVAMIPQSVDEVHGLGAFLGDISPFLFGVVPGVLLLVSMVSGKRGRATG